MTKAKTADEAPKQPDAKPEPQPVQEQPPCSAPEIAISSPKSGDTVNSPFVVTGTCDAKHASRVIVSAEKSGNCVGTMTVPNVSGNFSASLTVPPGVYQLRAVFEDCVEAATVNDVRVG
jgi:hypothetical protein